MSNFIYNSYCVEHPGLVPVYQADAYAHSHPKTIAERKLGVSWLLKAATCAAVLLALFELAIASTDGLLQLAGMALWAVGLVALAFWFAPLRRALRWSSAALRRWNQARRQAKADEEIWNAALKDARLMADLSRAMDRQQYA